MKMYLYVKYAFSYVIAAVLVFVAFYLSGMNVRIAVCLLKL